MAGKNIRIQKPQGYGQDVVKQDATSVRFTQAQRIKEKQASGNFNQADDAVAKSEAQSARYYNERETKRREAAENARKQKQREIELYEKAAKRRRAAEEKFWEDDSAEEEQKRRQEEMDEVSDYIDWLEEPEREKKEKEIEDEKELGFYKWKNDTFGKIGGTLLDATPFGHYELKSMYWLKNWLGSAGKSGTDTHMSALADDMSEIELDREALAAHQKRDELIQTKNELQQQYDDLLGTVTNKRNSGAKASEQELSSLEQLGSSINNLQAQIDDEQLVYFDNRYKSSFVDKAEKSQGWWGYTKKAFENIGDAIYDAAASITVLGGDANREQAKRVQMRRAQINADKYDKNRDQYLQALGLNTLSTNLMYPGTDPVAHNEDVAATWYSKQLDADAKDTKESLVATAGLQEDFDKWAHVDEWYKKGEELHQDDKLWKPGYWQYCMAGMIGSSNSSPSQIVGNTIQAAGMLTGPYGMAIAGAVSTPFDIAGGLEENKTEATEKRVSNFKDSMDQWDPEFKNAVLDDIKTEASKYWKQQGMSDKWIKDRYSNDDNVIKDAFSGIANGALNAPLVRQALLDSQRGLQALKDADNIRTLWETGQQKVLQYAPLGWIMKKGSRVVKRIGGKAGKSFINNEGRLTVSFQNGASVAERSGQKYSNGLMSSLKKGYSVGYNAADAAGLGGPASIASGVMGATANGAKTLIKNASPRLAEWSDDVSRTLQFKYQKVIDAMEKHGSTRFLRRYALPYVRYDVAQRLSEMGEEGAQYINSTKDFASRYGYDGMAFFEGVANDMETGSRVAESYLALLGIGHSELLDDAEYWKNVQGGFALGASNPGISQIVTGYNTVKGTKDTWSAYDAIQQYSSINREADRLIRRSNEQLANIIVNGDPRATVDAIEKLKQEDQRRENPNYRPEDYDHTIESAQQIAALHKNKAVRGRLEKIGIKPGTKEYNVAMADLANLSMQSRENDAERQELNAALNEAYSNKDFVDTVDKLFNEAQQSPDNIAERSRAIAQLRKSVEEAETEKAKENGVDVNSKEFKDHLQQSQKAAEERFIEQQDASSRENIMQTIKAVSTGKALLKAKAENNTANDLFEFIKNKTGVSTKRPDAKYVINVIDTQLKQLKRNIKTIDPAFNMDMSDSDFLQYLESIDIPQLNTDGLADLELANVMLAADKAIVSNYMQQFYGIQSPEIDEKTGRIKESETIKDSKYSKRIKAIIDADKTNDKINWLVADALTGDAVTKLTDEIDKEERELFKQSIAKQKELAEQKSADVKSGTAGKPVPEDVPDIKTADTQSGPTLKQKLDKNKEKYRKRKEKAKQQWRKRRNSGRGKARASLLGPLQVIVDIATDISYLAAVGAYKFSQFIDDVVDVYGQPITSEDMGYAKQQYMKALIAARLKNPEILNNLSTLDEVRDYGVVNKTPYMTPGFIKIDQVSILQAQLREMIDNKDTQLSTYYDTIATVDGVTRIYTNTAEYELHIGDYSDIEAKRIAKEFKDAVDNELAFTKLLTQYNLDNGYLKYRTLDGLSEMLGRTVVTRDQMVKFPDLEFASDIRQLAIAVFTQDDDTVERLVNAYNAVGDDLSSVAGELQDLYDAIIDAGMKPVCTNSNVYGVTKDGKAISQQLDLLIVDKAGYIHVIDILQSYTDVENRWNSRPGQAARYTISQREKAMMTQLSDILNTLHFVNIADISCLPIVGGSEPHVKKRIPVFDNPETEVTQDVTDLVAKINSAIDDYNQLKDVCDMYDIEFIPMSHIDATTHDTKAEQEAYVANLQQKLDEIATTKQYVQGIINDAIDTYTSYAQQLIDSNGSILPNPTAQDKIAILADCCRELDAKMDEVANLTPDNQTSKAVYDQFLVCVQEAQYALNDVLMDPEADKASVRQEQELIAAALEKLATNKEYFGASAVNIIRWWLHKFDPVTQSNTVYKSNAVAAGIIVQQYIDVIRSWLETLRTHIRQDLDGDTKLQQWYSTLLNNHFAALVQNAEELLNTADTIDANLRVELQDLISRSNSAIAYFNDRYQVQQDESVLGEPQTEDEAINRMAIQWISKYGKSVAYSPAFDKMAGGAQMEKKYRNWAMIYQEISQKPDFLEKATFSFSVSKDGDDIMLFIKYGDKSCYLPFITDLSSYPAGSISQEDIALIETSNKAKRDFFIPKMKKMIQYVKSHPEWQISFGKSVNKGEVKYETDPNAPMHNVQEFLFTGVNSKDLYTIRMSAEDEIGILIKRNPGQATETEKVYCGQNLITPIQSFDMDSKKARLYKFHTGALLFNFNTGNGDKIPVLLDRATIGESMAEKLVDLIYQKMQGQTYVDGYNIDDLLSMVLYMDDPNKRASQYSNTKNKIRIDPASNSVIIGSEVGISIADRQKLIQRLASMQIVVDADMLNENMQSTSNDVISSARQYLRFQDSVALPNGIVLKRDDITHQNSDGSYGSTWLGFMLRNGLIGTNAYGTGLKQLNIFDPKLVKKSQRQDQQDAADVEHQKQTSSVTNASDNDFWKKLSRGPSLHMDVLDQETVSRTKEEAEQFKTDAEKYFDLVFGSHDDLKVEGNLYPGLIPGTVATAYITTQYIYLATCAPESAKFHEAFHKLMELVLPNSQREFFYNVYREKYGKDNDLSDDRDVAEGLAEMFVDYIEHNLQVKRSKGFGKLYAWFKKLWFNAGFTIKLGRRNANMFYKLYQDMNAGKYANSKVSEENIERFNRVFGTEEGAKLFYTVDDPKLKNASQDFREISGRADLNDLVEALGVIYIKSRGISTANLLFAQEVLETSKIDDDTAQKMLDYLNDRIKLDGKTLDELYPMIAEVFEPEYVDTDKKDKDGNPIKKATYPKFKVLQSRLSEYISETLGADYHGKFKNEEDDEDEATQKQNIDKFDRASYEFSKLESASKRVKLFLSTLTRKLPNGLYDHSKNRTGYETFIPANEVFSRLVHDFGEARSLEEMLDMMEVAQNKSPMHKDVYEKVKAAIEDRYTFDQDGKLIVDYDKEQFAIQLYTCIKSQDMNFVLARTKTDNNRKHTNIISAGSERDAIAYPKMWNSLLTSGQVSIFSSIRSKQGELQLAKGHENDLRTVAAFFRSAEHVSANGGEILIDGKTVDTSTPEGFEQLKQEIVKQLHRIGITFPYDALVHMLEEQFTTPEHGGNSIEGLYAWLTQRNTASITPFLQVLEAWVDKNGNVNAEISKKGYTETGFVKALGNAYSRYTKSTTQSMVQALNGKQLYSVSQNSSLSHIINALNTHDKNNYVIQTLSGFSYNLLDEGGMFSGSMILKELFTNKNSTMHLRLATHIGSRTDNSGDYGTEYSEAPEVDDYMAKLAFLQNGYIVPCTFADKGTYQVIQGVTLPGMQFTEHQDSNGNTVVDIANIPTIKKYDGEFVIIPSNAVLDRMLEYARTEYNAIQQCMVDLGYKDIPGYNGVKRDPIPERAKIKNYHTNNGDIEPNGTRFLSLKQIVVPTKDGLKTINLNDPNKSSVELLKKAYDEFFSKGLDEQREIMALTLHVQTKEAVDFALSRGIVENENITMIQNGQTVVAVDATNPSKKLETLVTKHLDELQIATLTEAIVKAKKWGDNIADSQKREAYRNVAKSLAIASILEDATVKSIMSIEECQRLFIGHPGMFKVRYNESEGRIGDDTFDIQKRIGGIVSTGDDNYINDAYGLRSEYRCAEFKDHEIGLPTGVISQLEDAFEESATKDLLAQILSEQNHKDPYHVFSLGWKELQETIDGLSKKDKKRIEEASKKAKTWAQAYSKEINVADGAAYITDEMCELMLRERGAYNEDVKKAFQILRSEDSEHSWTEKAEAFELIYEKSAIVATKYTAYGVRPHTVSDKDGNIQKVSDVAVPYYNKFALFPIFPCLATGPMKQVYEKMKNERVDMLFMNSAVKVGSEGSIKYDPSALNKPFNVYTQNMGFLRRQLNTDPEEGTRIAIGTQMVKIVLSNLRLDRQYGDVDGNELLTYFMDNIKQLSKIGEEEVNEMFFTDGEIDNKKLSEFLKRELSSRGANNAVLSATDVVYNEDTGKFEFVIPMAATSDARWMESIIRSTICKRVVDITTPGGSFVQRSVFAIEAEDGESQILGDDSPYYHGQELKMINEYGSMDAVISIDYFQDMIPSHIKEFKARRQWLIDNKIIGPDAETATVAYRIPTQAQSSIHALRFIDVLPATQAAIVLPKEFTKITGSDFDIDHLYLATMNYKKVKEDIITGGDENITGEWLSRESYDLTEKQQCENNILGVMIKLLCDTGNSMSSLYRSIDNDTELPKSIADQIKPRKEDNKKHLPYNFGTLHEQVRRKSDYMTGKTGIGPFALNVTSHILTYLYEVEFNNSKFTNSTDIKSLHHLFDHDDNYVSSWISAFINAHVDIVKDPWISKLNVNPFTYNHLSLLVRSGVGNQACWMCAQPIIRDLAAAQQQAQSEILSDGGTSKAKRKQELFDAVLKKYGITMSWKELQAWGKNKNNVDARIAVTNSVLRHRTDELVDQAINPDNINYSLQNDVVKAFVALEPYAQGLSNLLQYTKVDTRKYGKNFIQMRCYYEKYLNAFYGDNDHTIYNIDSVHRMLENSWIDQKTRSAIQLPLQIMGQQTFDANEQFYNTIYRLCWAITQDRSLFTEDLMEAVSQQYRTAIKLKYIHEYATQVLGMTDNDIRVLFFGKDQNGSRSMASRLNGLKAAVKTHPEYQRLADNYLIEKLLPKTREDDTITSEGKLAKKPMFITISQDVNNERMNENAFSDAWVELLNDEDPYVRKFAEDLVVYAMYTSGEYQGFDKIAKHIPPEWLRGDTQKTPVIIDGVANNSFSDFIKYALTSSYAQSLVSDDMQNSIVSHLQDKFFIVQTIPQQTADGKQNFLSVDTDRSVLIGSSEVLDEDGNAPTFIKVKKRYASNKRQSSYNLYRYAGDANGFPVYVFCKSVGYKNGTENIYEYWFDMQYEENDSKISKKQNKFEDTQRIVLQAINDLFDYTYNGKNEALDQFLERASVYASQVYDKIDPNGGVQMPSLVRKKSVWVKARSKYSRESVENDPKTLYIFTDNTDRTSGGVQYGDGWYKQKYGAGGFGSYSNPTTAQIRGLDNAAPISTMRYMYSKHGFTHPGKDPNSLARWHDSDFEEFKKVFDDEIAQIKALWDTGRFEKIVSPQGDGFFGSRLTDLSKARTPKIYEYMNQEFEKLYQYVNSGSDRQVESVDTNTTFEYARTAEGKPNYEVSSRGDSRFSAMNATFAPGTTLFGHDVGGRTIESVYQHGVKQGDWSTDNNNKTGAPKDKTIITGNTEDDSYVQGYLPLWEEWAKQNPQLIQELRQNAKGKVLTDMFASTAVSQARALADILNNNQSVPSPALNTLHGRQATHEEELATLNSGKTILSNEELAVWNKNGVGKNPRILVATEKSDAAFHSKEIVDIINGVKSVTNRKYTVITKEEYDSLPRDQKWYKQATDQYFRVDTTSFSPSDFAGLYIITKHDGLPMRDILATKIPKLIHFSITGLGGTVYEPGVMKPNDLLDRIGDYIKQGLDPDMITVRIDPIVPGVTTPSMIENIVKRASELGIKRIRFSIMDAYKNTVNKMQSLGYNFDSKYHWAEQDGVRRRVVNDDVKNSIVNFMLSMKDKYDVTIGTCAEDIHVDGITNEGCLSVDSVNRMLGSNIEDRGTDNNNQRVLCSCYGGKVDALAYDKYCGSACAYCYGKHENDAVHQYYNQDGTLKQDKFTMSGYTGEQTPDEQNGVKNNNIQKPSTGYASSIFSEEEMRLGEQYKNICKNQ